MREIDEVKETGPMQMSGAPTPDDVLRNRLFDPSWPKTELEHFAKHEIDRLTEELKSKDEEIQRLNELVFAYESVNAPINPLLAEKQALTERIAELSDDSHAAGTRKHSGEIRMKHIAGCDWFAGECGCGANNLNVQTDRLTAEKEQLILDKDAQRLEINILLAEKQAQAEQIEKLESAKAEPGEFSSCGTVKSLLDQLGRHRHLFDQMVAENERLKEKLSGMLVENKDQAERIAELQKYERFYQHIKSHLTSDQVVICKICGKSLLEIEQVLEAEEAESAKAQPETTDDELDYLTAENERLAKNAYLLPFYKARMEREIVRQVELTAELAEARKKPEPTEQTKKWRAYAFFDAEHPASHKIVGMIKYLREACDCVDAQQQQIERLKVENVSKNKEIIEAFERGYADGKRHSKAEFEAEIGRLTAENKRLRDDTDCETESGGIRCIEQEDKILAHAERIARLEKALAVAIEYIGESSSDELAAQYDIKQAVKGEE